jgi:hypothetical protein
MRRSVAAVALVALVFGVPGATLAKKKPQKRTVSATVGGKHITWTGRFVVMQNNGIPMIAATKIGATKTIGLGCPALTPGTSGPLPIGCDLTYFSARVDAHRRGATRDSIRTTPFR